MPQHIHRRSFLASGLFGLGGLLLPTGGAAAALLGDLSGFTHNVASGEPTADSMLLWTRYVPVGRGPAKLRVEVSETSDFVRIVTGGEMVTGPWRDHTAKIVVEGLAPATRYFYRFIAPDGTFSPVGRTRTLPAGRVDTFKMAIFSCSNLGYGEFNAYGHAAQDDTIALAIHLGDYIYEYDRAGYSNTAAFAQRIYPDAETLALADYRLRYASYRLDPQLQALHAAMPVIPSVDDHEAANDMWEGGAQNHSASEGDWTLRRLAAMQAWREWLPVGEQPWQSYAIGELATYYRTDMRSVARSSQRVLRDFLVGGDAQKALAEFRDGAWRDPAATMMGSEQEHWLHRAIARDRSTWAVLGSGTNMGYNSTPAAAMGWLGADATERNKNYLRDQMAAAQAGLPYNFDNWGGYPAARSRLLAAAQQSEASLVVVSGDSHNGWAFDLPEGGRPAGVEFGGHSVTSPGIENMARGIAPDRVARALLAANPSELRWADTSNRGYMRMTLTPQAAVNEWVFMQTIMQRSLATKASHRMQVRPHRNRLEQA